MLKPKQPGINSNGTFFKKKIIYDYSESSWLCACFLVAMTGLLKLQCRSFTLQRLSLLEYRLLAMWLWDSHTQLSSCNLPHVIFLGLGTELLGASLAGGFLTPDHQGSPHCICSLAEYWYITGFVLKILLRMSLIITDIVPSVYFL